MATAPAHQGICLMLWEILAEGMDEASNSFWFPGGGSACQPLWDWHCQQASCRS